MRHSRVAEILASVADGGGNGGGNGNGDGNGSSLAVRLCRQCVAAVPVSGAGLALMSADGPTGVVLAATDRAARHLEELQFTMGEGPCVDASREGRPVLQPDLLVAAAHRWPEFTASALTAGVRAIFAFPLQVGAIRVGVLDLYRHTPGHLTDAQFADTLAFADAATLLLLQLQGGRDGAGQIHPQLNGVLESRAVVHQATGMISVQLGVGLGDAMLRLRAHAYAQARPVYNVAGDVVGRRLRFDDSETGHSTANPQ